MIDIVIVGSVNMDLVTMVDRIPRPGETLMGNSFHQIPGGKGANQAVAAARLGGKTAIVGRVGKDSLGGVLREGLDSNKVDTTYLLDDQDLPSGTASIWVENSGQNSIVVAGGANGNVSSVDIDNASELITSARYLIMQFEIPAETVRYAAKIARAAGVKVILNAAPANASCLEWLDMVNILVVNESEAESLTGIPVCEETSGMEAARKLIEKGAQIVVLTLGAGGALWVSKEESVHIFPYMVQAIDTTAAGDAFVGALVVALSEGKNWREAMQFASVVGALTVTRMGAQSSLPTREELNKFLESKPVI